MLANVTFFQVVYNGSLFNFFFRSQAQRTVNDLLSRVDSIPDTIDAIEEYCSDNEIDMDELEEMFYSYGTEDVAEALCITLNDEDED